MIPCVHVLCLTFQCCVLSSTQRNSTQVCYEEDLQAEPGAQEPDRASVPGARHPLIHWQSVRCVHVLQFWDQGTFAVEIWLDTDQGLTTSACLFFNLPLGHRPSISSWIYLLLPLTVSSMSTQSSVSVSLISLCFYKATISTLLDGVCCCALKLTSTFRLQHSQKMQIPVKAYQCPDLWTPCIITYFEQ